MSASNKHPGNVSVGSRPLLLSGSSNRGDVDQLKEMAHQNTTYQKCVHVSQSQSQKSLNKDKEEMYHDCKRRRLESLGKSPEDDHSKYDISYSDLDKWLGTMVADSDAKNQPLIMSRRSSITSVTSFSEESQNDDVGVYVSDFFDWSATQVEIFPSELSDTKMEKDEMQCFREEALLSYQKKIGIINDSAAHSTLDPSLDSAALLSSTQNERNQIIAAPTTTRCYHEKQKNDKSQSKKDQQRHLLQMSHIQAEEEAVCVVSNLTQTMSTSQKSEHALLEWDRRMGLRRNHCRTMGATSKSRKRLNEVYSSASLQPKQSFAKGA